MLGLMIMMMLANWEKNGLTIWHIWSLRFYDDKKYFCMIFFSQKITKKYFKKKSIFLYFKKYLAITLTSKIEREKVRIKRKPVPKLFSSVFYPHSPLEFFFSTYKVWIIMKGDIMIDLEFLLFLPLSISLSRTPIACKLIEIFLLYCFCFHILPPHFLPSRSCSILLCCLMIKFYSSGKFVGLLFYYFLPFTVYFISVSLSLPYALINFAIQQAQFSLPLSFTIFFSVLRNHMLELKWIMWHICKCEKCENARPVNVQRNLRLLMKTNENGKSKFFLIKIFQRNFREIYL